MKTGNITLSEILIKLREIKPLLSTQYGVLQLAVFGSFAKDLANSESDIDVAVEMIEPDLYALVHIKDELESNFNRKVDVTPLSQYMNPFLKKRIASEAYYV